MDPDELADRIAEVIEHAAPRVRKVLLLTKKRKFPEGVAEPDKRFEQAYWVRWRRDLKDQIDNDKLKPIGYTAPGKGPGAAGGPQGPAGKPPKPRTPAMGYAGRGTAARSAAGRAAAPRATAQPTAQATPETTAQADPQTTAQATPETTVQAEPES